MEWREGVLREKRGMWMVFWPEIYVGLRKFCGLKVGLEAWGRGGIEGVFGGPTVKYVRGFRSYLRGVRLRCCFGVRA